MNILLLSFLLWIADNRSLDAIVRGNEARLKAQQAYQSGDYWGAVLAYRNVLSASMFTQPEARLNLAHAYFNLKQWQNAEQYYTRLATIKQPILAARAQMQLGVIKVLRKDTVAALQWFQKSLITNPANRLAAYNYELLKKQYSGTIPTPPNPISLPPPKSFTLTPQADEIAKNNEKIVILSQLKNLNMTEAQALMLLDALKNAEIQYLQQQKRKTTPQKGNR